MATELEVPSLASDLGTDQQSGPVVICKPSGVSVSLNKGEFLVENGRLDVYTIAKTVFDRCRLGLCAADEKEFFGIVFTQ